MKGFQAAETETIYVSTGTDVIIKCPNDGVNSWQYCKSKEVLAVCEKRQHGINPALNLSERISVTSDCQLKIHNFTTRDLGTYFCVATTNDTENYKINVKLRDTETVEVDNSSVIPKPKVLITVLLNSRVTKEHKSILVRQGNHVQLKCRDESEENNDVEIFLWFFNGLFLQNNSNMVVIENIIPERSGEYTCVVKNKAGVGYDAVNITVTCNMCSHLLVIPTYAWKIGVISSAAGIGLLLCLYGLNALAKKFCLNEVQNRNHTSQGNVTTPVIHEGQYDDIDNEYYNIGSGIDIPEFTLTNTTLDTLLSSINARNLVNNTTNNDENENSNDNGSGIYGTESNISGVENVSMEFSSNDSYNVPCRNYINLDFGVTIDHQDQIREQEYLGDGSSASNSENSEIQMKSDNLYETLATSNVEEHSYETTNKPY